MKYILTQNGISLFFKNKPVTVSKGDQKYAKLIQALSLPDDEQDQAVLKALEGANNNTRLAEKGFVIKGNDVAYQGESLPQPLAQKVLSLVRENLPVDLLENFWKNLKKNPSYQSIKELYDFLAYKELPITEDGCFIAYRGLQSDFYSVHGNLSTKVLKGKVNGRGQIYNGVGEKIEIERSSCDDDRNKTCSVGLHCASHKYASGWSRGKLVAVKINPKDVVSVPTDYNGQKLRCCAYEVLCEISVEMDASVTDKNGNKIQNPFYSQATAELSYLEKRIESYLQKQIKNGVRKISIKKIQSIFSPSCPSTLEICNALNSLGFTWKAKDKMVIL